MTREKFLELIDSKVVLLDGATGSNLQKRGMPTGVCPEKWILDHKEVLIGLQKEYIEAGSDILYAPTFSGNRIKLKEYGLENQVSHMNGQLIGLTREAVRQARENGTEREVYIAGDLTMTGEQLYPMGKLAFEELVQVYKEQIGCMVSQGVDMLVVETMMSLNECRAAVLAAKETCDLPVLVTLTFNEDGRTLYGTDPATAVVVLENMGADAIGVNCSTGPDKMVQVVKAMREYSCVPIIAKPNAGLPHLKNGITIYDMEPEEFAHEVKNLVLAGAGIVGGCCGTTPDHIRCLAGAVGKMQVKRPGKPKVRALTTERNVLTIGLDDRFLVVGERINPTGKKALQAQLREGKLDMVLDMAQEQAANGAHILDINMGMNGIDEKEMMIKAIYEVNGLIDIPLCIDSSHVEVIEAALRIYPGRALINSISMETEKLEKLLSVAKKYGAMFILLPLSDQGLPQNLAEKIEIIHKILDRAWEWGLTKEDIIVDGLVNTIGANKKAALETLETIRYCKEDLELATICGLSNISFGLPERQFVNSTFLTMAIKEGLTMAIANPSQNLLMTAAYGAELLLNRQESDIRYINRVRKHPVILGGDKGKNTMVPAGEIQGKEQEQGAAIYEAVVKGNRKQILEFTKQELESGKSPSQILDTMLIPAINQVGELFDKQIYFLPQLISSAETMKKAIDYLEPMLERDGGGQKAASIVVATVAGDIHDIGKNLVVLMLKNYGFDVTDLGKDVPAEKIIETAKEKDADIIGLSALMTTTMMEMKHVVELARAQKLKAKIIIGGAVITQSFADEIGADGYSRDAQEAVKLVKRLLNLD